MSNQMILQEELANLPKITMTFSPDRDDTAKFELVLTSGQTFPFSVLCDDQRTVTFDPNMNSTQRIVAMHASEILIDQVFDETSRFNTDEEDDSVLHYAVHSQCMNFAFYANSGRLIDGYEQL